MSRTEIQNAGGAGEFVTDAFNSRPTRPTR